MKKRRKAAPPFQASIRKVEWFIAFALTGLAVVLHVVNLTHAGGLWRDEAAAVNLALFPSFGEIWSHLEHESFPLLLTVLLRGWSAIGLGETDLGWRFFGLLVGLSVLAALWWNAWQFSKSPPLLSLLLFGLSPTLIRWGDSLRAYGLGVFFLLLALGLISKVARAPSRRTVILATAASVLAVQALYQSMFMLVAFCLGGALLGVRRRDFKRALLVLALIVPPALSLLPYLGVINRANQWNVVTEVPLGLSRIWLVFQRALGAPGPIMFWAWALLLLGAIVTAFVVVRTKKKTSGNNDDRDAAWFLVTVIVAVTGAYYLFLTLLKFPTEAWYYLAWMGVVAVAIEALLGRIIREDRVRVLRLAGVALLAAIMAPGIWRQAQVRMTNLDLVLAQLNREAGSDDLVLMHPWFCGPAFGRYYKSKAPWLTLPPLNDHTLQRLDLFKEQMQQDAPIQPVLEKMEATLRGGHVVWLVGYYPFSNPPRPPPPLPRAGEGPGGWNEAPYMTVYGMQVAYFLQANALETKSFKLDSTQAVNPFENFPVMAVSGWRSSRF
jgi:hypothetical protein